VITASLTTLEKCTTRLGGYTSDLLLDGGLVGLRLTVRLVLGHLRREVRTADEADGDGDDCGGDMREDEDDEVLDEVGHLGSLSGRIGSHYNP
jgi:hypothetical protein